MTSPVSYSVAGGVAQIVLDDGKVNVLSPAMQAAINAALDQAETDGAVAVLEGRQGVWSAGFDLAVLRSGGPDALGMLQGGFRLAERLLTFPTPTVIACPGHAIAMGAFLLLSADYRVGMDGAFRITANETAIGMTLPRAAVELCRLRLTAPALHAATILSTVYSPSAAATAGFLDVVAAPEEFEATVTATATAFAALNAAAHQANKLRVRAEALTRLRSAIEADDADMGALA